MRHYHLIFGREGSGLPIASLKYANYEDSLVDYVKLSTLLFGHIQKDGALSIENARASTSNGDAWGSMVGTHALAIYWLRCDAACVSFTWN